MTVLWEWVLVRRWAITGTLDPIRYFTKLTIMDLQMNRVGGMPVTPAVWILCWVESGDLRMRTHSQASMCFSLQSSVSCGYFEIALSGTLEPLRDLTGLRRLYLSNNTLEGTFDYLV
jgi:hypothetical protein